MVTASLVHRYTVRIITGFFRCICTPSVVVVALLTSASPIVQAQEPAPSTVELQANTYTDNPADTERITPEVPADAATSTAQQPAILPHPFPQWTSVATGLDLLALTLTSEASSLLRVDGASSPEVADLAMVRANPALYEFTLHMASENGKKSSLGELADTHGLYAAINASMYQADQMTSTGYLQSASHTNNAHIAARFGAFFLAEPRREDLPPALMLEKSSMGDTVQDRIQDYNVVVQNFRLISATGKVLWPESTNRHSISALAADADGHILLILCRRPLSAPEFARLIKQMPIGIGLTMYLEGGVECGLLTRTPPPQSTYYIWRGKHNGIIEINGAASAALPNVLGLRPRNAKKN